MTIILIPGPDIVPRYREWLSTRRYAYETIDRFANTAKMIIAANPNGIPLDLEILTEQAQSVASTPGAKKFARTLARRFHDFLECVAVSSGGGA